MATVINNKALMTVSSKFDHAELIGSHYFGIDAKVKKKRLKTRPPRVDKASEHPLGRPGLYAIGSEHWLYHVQ